MGDLTRLRAEVTAAMRVGQDAPAEVAAVVARALPGDGATITLMTSDVQRHTLAFTGQVAATIEQAQHLVGEGPSLDAFTSGRPVLVPDLGDAGYQAAWPGLTDQLGDLPVRGLFAFPLRVGAIVVGVASSYRRSAGELDHDDLVFALRVVDVLTLALLQIQDNVSGHDDEVWLGDGMPGDRAVHQATGIIMVHLGGVSAAVAFARLRGYSFTHDRTLQDVATDIVAGHLTLPADTTNPA